MKFILLLDVAGLVACFALSPTRRYWAEIPLLMLLVACAVVGVLR